MTEKKALVVGSGVFSIVEYPGYISNIDQVLATLNQSEDSVELNYRPSDPICHPIKGRVLNTSNLLLKTTKTRAKGTLEWTVTHEIVGVVTRTARFRSLSDYQPVLDEQDPMYRLAQNLHSWNVDGIKSFEMSTDMGTSLPVRNVIPPQLSMTEWSIPYDFKQVKTEKVARSKSQSIQVDFDLNAAVPTEPLQETVDFVNSNSEITSEFKQTVQNLFNSRPIWTLLQLKKELKDDKKIKILVPLYAFLMRKGPWRNCWIKFGFNPMTSPEARIYQTIEIRTKNQPTRTLCLVDMQDEQVRKTIENSMTHSTEISLQDGWFLPGIINEVRNVARKRLQGEEILFEFDPNRPVTIRKQASGTQEKLKQIIEQEMTQRVNSQVEQVFSHYQQQMDIDSDIDEFQVYDD